MEQTVRIVIVEYDGGDVLSRCLTSLSNSVDRDIPITLIDNASPAPVADLIPNNLLEMPGRSRKPGNWGMKNFS
jgi:GT2 family glycosyltransferase